MESVILELKIRNPSILIQEFGFLNLPESIRIKPSFGEIIPGEEIILKVYFSAEKAQIYNFEFELSTLRGFQATFQAKGVGVHPPLMASQSKLEFETPLYDSSRKQFSIRNEHFDKDQYKHPVPRIGPDGTIFPVGPTSFSIQEPADSGLVFSPCVGTIKPGEEMVISGIRDPRTLISLKTFDPILMDWGLTKIIRNVCWSVSATYCPTLNESEIENKMSEYTIKAGFQIDA